MDMEFDGRTLKIDKELSELDRLVIKFVDVLDSQRVDYVIISGYVPILFGRSRDTEDIDVFIEELEQERLGRLWSALDKEGFECINAEGPEDALRNYLKEKLAIRFALKGSFIPNFELKFPRTKHNIYSMKRKVKVVLNGRGINTSELELQIAFKLKLGSEKDFEDARHLYRIFEKNLDMGLLRSHISELAVEREAEKILWKKA